MSSYMSLDNNPKIIYLSLARSREGTRTGCAVSRGRAGARGRASQARARAAPGLRPGALRPPARSSLTVDRQGPPEAFARGHPQGAANEGRKAERDGTPQSAAPAPRGKRRTARREAPREPQGARATEGLPRQPARRPPPLPKGGQRENPGRMRAAGTMEFAR